MTVKELVEKGKVYCEEHIEECTRCPLIGEVCIDRNGDINNGMRTIKAKDLLNLEKFLDENK